MYTVITGPCEPDTLTQRQPGSTVGKADGALVDAVVEPEGYATCPTCHRVDATLTNTSLAAGANWRCGRCGQLWDQKRIATVAAYDAWDSARRQRALQR